MNIEDRKNLQHLDELILNASDEELEKIQETVEKYWKKRKVFTREVLSNAGIPILWVIFKKFF